METRIVSVRSVAAPWPVHCTATGTPLAPRQLDRAGHLGCIHRGDDGARGGGDGQVPRRDELRVRLVLGERDRGGNGGKVGAQRW